MSANLLPRLREATRARHAQLDDALSGEMTRERYARFLRATLAVIEVIEPELARWIPWLATPARTPRLVADLAALGEAHRADEPAAIAVPHDRASAYGSAYVVEGSSLGGLVLAERYEGALGLATERGTGYLRLRGEATPKHWGAFVKELAAVDRELSDAERDEACIAATGVFDAYQRAFVAHGVIT